MEIAAAPFGHLAMTALDWLFAVTALLRWSQSQRTLVGMERQYYVYILANRHNTVLYTGVTGDLARRMDAHRAKAVKGFTAKYNADKLVYYEVADDPTVAITREKQIKAGSRQKKLALVNGMNPGWRDLAETL